MTGWELTTSAWEWHPSVIAGCVLLLAAYLAVVRARINRTTLLFAGGVVTVFVALVSPLDALSDDYLFSAHMLQHMLLDFVAPLLFVLGLPADAMHRAMQWRAVQRTERVLGNPLLAWWLGNFTLWIWHVPLFYNATLANEQVHVFEHLTLLVTGTILWWPVFAPLAMRRLKPLAGLIYVLTSALSNGLLGIVFTFLNTPLYPAYEHPEDPLGVLPLIRGQWGLDVVTDQQLGGAIMWVLGSVIFLWAALVLVTNWYREAEEK